MTVLEEGESFGEWALVRNEKRSATVRVLKVFFFPFFKGLISPEGDRKPNFERMWYCFSKPSEGSYLPTLNALNRF